MKYTVHLTRTAEKQLKKLHKQIQTKVAAVLLSLQIDPWPYGSKKLSGMESTFRIRVGDYRVIYEIQKNDVIVTVLKIGNRKDVYR